MKGVRERAESETPEVAEEGRLGRLSPRRCPYWERCGYQGVFLWTRLFEDHMKRFHAKERAEPRDDS